MLVRSDHQVQIRRGHRQGKGPTHNLRDDTGSGSAGSLMSLVRPGSVTTRCSCLKAEPEHTGKTESQEEETEKLNRQRR